MIQQSLSTSQSLNSSPAAPGSPFALNAVDSKICVLFDNVIPAKAVILKVLKKPDFRLHGNDV